MRILSVFNAGADTDRFLVQDGTGAVKFRTGAEVAADIGAANIAASQLKHTVKAAVALTKGQAVYVSGADGTNMLVSKASNATESMSTKTMGLIDRNLAINDMGDVITEGLLAGLNTSTATIGDPVWLGVDGNLLYGLANKPLSPAHLVFIGIVTRVQTNNGEIFVKVQNGFELGELHDVLITGTPVDKAVIQYDTASGLWKNSALGGVTASTGTAGQVAYFTGATTQAGSNNLFWDATNNRLGVGTNSPLYRFDVQGTSGTVAIRAASSTAGDILYYATGTVTGSLNAFTTSINATGAVGATLLNGNTATGSAFLDINVPSASTGDPYITFTTSGATNWSIGTDNSDSDKLKIGPVSNPSNSSTALVLHTNGNISAGTATDSGQRLQVIGDTLLKGSGNTTGTTALTVTNSSASNNELLKVRNDGAIIIGYAGSTASPLLYSHNRLTPGTITNLGAGLSFSAPIGSQEGTRFWFGSQYTQASTSGTNRHIFVEYNINEVGLGAGSATYSAFTIQGSIAQEAASTGITRGVYVNPTITAAADYRAFEGNIAAATGRWNLYMNGSAPNYLNGELLLGSTSNTGEKLQVTGTMKITGATSITNTMTARQVIVDGANNSNISRINLTRTDASWGIYNETDFRIYYSTGNTTTPTTQYFSLGSGTGIATISGAVIGASFIPSGSSVPTNGMYLPTTNTLAWSTNTTERMRLDASGNLGLGVTPSAWFTANNLRALQLTNGATVVGALLGGEFGTVISNNWFANSSGANAYIANGVATQYVQISGQHRWLNAASGTANATFTFTQAMTLDASGNLGVGTASPYANLDLGKSGANNIILRNTSNAYNLGYIGNAGGRIDIGFSNSNGSLVTLPYLSVTSLSNVLIGSTSDTGEKFQVTGTAKITGATTIGGGSSATSQLDVTSNSNANGITLRNRTGNDYAFFIWRSLDGSELLAESYIERTAANTATLRHTINNGSGVANYLTIASTGAATFSSSVTAGSFIKSGGTSSQVLLADGTAYTFPLAISSPSNGQVLKYNGTSWVNDSDAGITGSGSSGQVAYFTGATTQAGSNNLFWDNTNGRLGIGTNTPSERLYLLNSSAAAGGIIDCGLGNSVSFLQLKNSAASGRAYSINVGGASSSFGANFFIYDNTAAATRVTLFSTGNFGINTGATDSGQRLQVIGTSYLSDTLRVDGVMSQGNATSPDVNFYMRKGLSGSAYPSGIYMVTTIASTSISGATMFITDATTQAASFTLPRLEHFKARQTTFGAGSTVTNQYGFFAESTLNGATNNYGFYGDIAAATGRWNLYMNGTADNYILGNTLIGIASNPNTYKLLVNGGRIGANNGIRLGVGYSAIDVETGVSGLYLSGSQGALDHLFINNVGRVLIGSTTDTTEKLQVNGTMKVTGASTFGGTITASGRYIVNVATSAGISDISYGSFSGGVFINTPSGTTGYLAANGNQAISWTTNNLKFYISAAERMTLDTSGNLGLGVTPSAWPSGYGAMQIGYVGSLAGRPSGSGIYLSSNVYFVGDPGANGANARYIQTTTAGSYAVIGNNHYWFTAPSGTLNTAITLTQAMTLDASGRLGIGTTSPLSKFVVSDGGLTGIEFGPSDANNRVDIVVFDRVEASYKTLRVLANDILFKANQASVDAMSITSLSNVLIGSTSDSGEKLQVTGTAKITGATAINDNLTVSKTQNSTTSIIVSNPDTTTATYSTQAQFRVDVAGNQIGALKATARNLGGLSRSALYLTTIGNYDLAFGVNSSGTPSMVLDINQNFGIGLTAPTERLHVSGNTIITGNLTVDTNTLFVDATNNRVGIGTASPAAALHVIGTESRFGGVASGFISLYNANTRSGYIQANQAVDLRIASDTDPMTFYVGGSERMRISTAGNLLIGSTSDTTEKLQVTGTAKITGILSLGSNLSVLNGFTINSAGSNNLIGAQTTQGAAILSISNIYTSSRLTAGTQSTLDITNTFNPTSGPALHHFLNLTFTVNQTGGANGITRGIYLNATLTAAADFRGIEWTNNTGWGLYGAGSASNYLQGSLGIGTASINASAKLQIDSTTQGFLPPRMTSTQRSAISSPSVGLVVYQTDGVEGLYIYTNTNGWKSLAIVN